MKVDTKSLVKKLESSTLKALELSINLAVTQNIGEVSVAHWLCKIAEQPESIFCLLLEKNGIKSSDFIKSIKSEVYDIRGSHKGVPTLAKGITTLIHDSWLIASVDYSATYINAGHIFICFISNLSAYYINSLTKSLLQNLDVTKIKQSFVDIIDSKKNTDIHPLQEEQFDANALNTYTTDLIKYAKQGLIDRAIGRSAELNQIIDILCRRKQNNPILVGEAGVGKTAIVEELAFFILEGNVPAILKGISLRLLDFAALQAGASVQGEFESRIQDLLSDIQKSTKKVILFVDEIHNFLGGSKGADAANLLKPALARGLSVIGATTWAEYKKSFEKDTALNRRFQLVKVLEPSEETARDIMRGVANVLEKHHNVQILDSAILDAVSLSVRYMNHIRLPDKAISLLDTACARIKLQQSMPPLFVRELWEKIVLKEHYLKRLEKDFLVSQETKNHILEEITNLKKEYEKYHAQWKDKSAIIASLVDIRKKGNKEEYLTKLQDLLNDSNKEVEIYPAVDGQLVADILSDWTGIPVSNKGNKEELEAMLDFDEKIKERVIGQDHAVEQIVNTIRISKANMSDPRKPIGVFLLVGESGVGKTETALSIAQTIYGHESHIITINMSEYKEGHKIATLIGSPPGYIGYGEGGRLTEQVRRNPYSVILLDEIEKAHPNVQDLFLQVFDKGTLADSEGLVVDFKNTVIMMTSNLGSKTIREFCSNIRSNDDAEHADNALDENQSMLHSQSQNGQSAAQFDEDKLDGENLSQENENNDIQEQKSKTIVEKPIIKKDISKEDIQNLSIELHAQLLKSLKPEFLGRIVTIPYLSLTHEILQNIIKLQLDRIAKRLKDNHGSIFTYDDTAIAQILQSCELSSIGARQIEHIITDEILPDLSMAILDIKSQQKRFGLVNLSSDGENFLIDIKNVSAL